MSSERLFTGIPCHSLIKSIWRSYRVTKHFM